MESCNLTKRAHLPKRPAHILSIAITNLLKGLSHVLPNLECSQTLLNFHKTHFPKTATFIHLYVYIYIRTVAQGGREERTNKTQNMVSISWYLPEKVRDELSKTQHILHIWWTFAHLWKSKSNILMEALWDPYINVRKFIRCVNSQPKNLCFA